MELRDSFKAFSNRVLHAARMGHLPRNDTRMLEHLLLRARKRNLVLSRAILTSLSGGNESEQDVKKFAHLLEMANRHIAEEKEPFSAQESRDLEELFRRHSLSLSAARKFIFSLDELLAMELMGQMDRNMPLPRKVEGHARPIEKEKLAH
ncbi:MAG: hypothetical protein PHS02_01165 [Candidatus ainarchaeum sp.]|nr:hypothetical protein [Candidatus ainarchaeum sp.]